MVDLPGTKCQAGTGVNVAQVPEPRRKVSSRCRIHAVKHEPELHTSLSGSWRTREMVDSGKMRIRVEAMCPPLVNS